MGARNKKTAPSDDTDDAVAWGLACSPRLEQGSTVLETAALPLCYEHVLRIGDTDLTLCVRKSSGRQYRNRTCVSCESDMRSAIELTACCDLWWRRLGSNQRPRGYEPRALPTKLHRRIRHCPFSCLRSPHAWVPAHAPDGAELSPSSLGFGGAMIIEWRNVRGSNP